MVPTQFLACILVARIMLVVSVTSSDISFTNLFKPISYQLDLSLPPELFTKDGLYFSGKVRITFSFNKVTDRVAVHANLNFLKLNRMFFNDTEVHYYNYNSKTNIVTIPLKRAVIIGTPYNLVFEYSASTNIGRVGLHKSTYSTKKYVRLARKYTDHYLIIMQLGSAHARTVFPCFDEPGLKATFDVSITFPTGLKAIFNTKELTVSNFAHGSTRVRFRTTPVMSTHVLAFIVGNLTCTTHSGEIPIRVCSRKEVKKKRDFTLDLTYKLLGEYNSFTKHNYYEAIGKLDIVAVYDFVRKPPLEILSRETELLYNTSVAFRNVHGGVKENWGLIIQMESQVLHSHNESSMHEGDVILAISHELAHQWFGGLVTFTDWSEIFVHRGLAAYFQTHMANKIYYRWDFEKLFVVDCLHEILVYDAFDNVHPLYYKGDPREIEANYNELSYKKGGIIMRMVQHALGLDNFRMGIRRFIDMYKFRNVGINDLWEVLDSTLEHSGINLPADLSTVMKNWITHRGYPLINVSLIEDTIKFSQSKFVYHPSHLKNAQTKWYVPISFITSEDIDLFTETTPNFWLTPHDDEWSVTFNYPPNIRWILLNHQQTGYYRVNYDKTLLSNISDALQKPDFDGISEINRAHLVDDFFNLARAGIMSYPEVLKNIKFLEHDISYYPWKAATEGFRVILRRVGYSSSAGKLIVKDMLDLMENLYSTVFIKYGIEPDLIHTLKKQLALDWACRMDHERCIEDVDQQFGNNRVKQRIRIDANLKFVTHCNGLRHWNPSRDYENAWYRMLDNANDEPNFSEQQVFLSAFACMRLPAYVKKYFVELLRLRYDQISFTDFMFVLIETENNPEAIEAAFEFIMDERKSLIDRYNNSDELEYIFRGIVERLHSPENIGMLTACVKRGCLQDGLKEFGPQALEAIESIRRWSNKFGSEIDTYYNNSEIDYYRITATVGVIVGVPVAFYYFCKAYNLILRYL